MCVFGVEQRHKEPLIQDMANPKDNVINMKDTRWREKIRSEFKEKTETCHKSTLYTWGLSLCV